jgi:uncharacterized protein YkwD
VIRKERVGVLATVAMVLVGLVAILPPANALTNCTVAAAELVSDTEEQDLIRRLNEYRTANGLNTVTLDTSVTRAATWFAVDMATKNYFPSNHVDSFGRNPATRLSQCDVAWTKANENIAAGYSTGAETFLQWRNSPSHNTNMLQPNVSLAGVGRAFDPAAVYGWYWTLNLTAPGSVDSSTTTSTTSTSTSSTSSTSSTTLFTSTSTSSTSSTALPTSTSTSSTSSTTLPTSTSTSSTSSTTSSTTTRTTPRNFTSTPLPATESAALMRQVVCPILAQLAADPVIWPFIQQFHIAFRCI